MFLDSCSEDCSSGKRHEQPPRDQPTRILASIATFIGTGSFYIHISVQLLYYCSRFSTSPITCKLRRKNHPRKAACRKEEYTEHLKPRVLQCGRPGSSFGLFWGCRCLFPNRWDSACFRWTGSDYIYLHGISMYSLLCLLYCFTEPNATGVSLHNEIHLLVVHRHTKGFRAFVRPKSTWHRPAMPGSPSEHGVTVRVTQKNSACIRYQQNLL